MKRLAFLPLLALLLSCASSSTQVDGGDISRSAADGNLVTGEIALPGEAAFREVRGAIFRGGNIILEENAAAGTVRGDWRYVQQALPLAVVRFIFTRHEDPQISYQALVTDLGGGRSRVELTARGRHLINRFFRQEWSQPYPLPASDEVKAVLRGYLSEAQRNAESLGR